MFAVIPSLIGAATTVAGGLLSKGGKGEEQRNVSYTQFQPSDWQRVMGQLAPVQAATQQYANLGQQLGQQLQAPVGALPGISAFTPATGLDALSKAYLSTGQQGLLQQISAQQAQIARQFANNPAMMQALQAQAGARGALQANPLLMAAQQEQAGRQFQEAQARLAAEQSMVNRAQAQAALESQRRTEQMQLAGQGVSAQQNLLDILQNLARAQATQYGTQTTSPTDTSNIWAKLAQAGVPQAIGGAIGNIKL